VFRDTCTIKRDKRDFVLDKLGGFIMNFAYYSSLFTLEINTDWQAAR
jgi:hypothetical protein